MCLDHSRPTRAANRGSQLAWHEGPMPSTTWSTSPSPSQVPTSASGLADYLARIPRFDPAPVPVRVALPHYIDHAALAYEIPTTQKVAFLTIDDGLVRHPMALELIRQAKNPVTLFLTTNYVYGNQEYFLALKNTGHVAIEGHTISHPHLTQSATPSSAINCVAHPTSWDGGTASGQPCSGHHSASGTSARWRRPGPAVCGRAFTGGKQSTRAGLLPTLR